jgi:integrase
LEAETMPKAKLTTNEAVAQLPNPKTGQPIYWCTELTGFGVRCGAREKVYILQRRVNGDRPRVIIGRVGAISLQRARKDAQQLIGEMAGGTDPVARKAEETAGGMTLRQAWVLYQQKLRAKKRSQVTIDDYAAKIAAHLTDWLDKPLANITRDMTNERHLTIGRVNGEYMANGVMRVLRAIWRRARRGHPALPEPPTVNVDFFGETRRTKVVNDMATWWKGIHQIVSPVRRDFYIWLAFTGCRSGETMEMRWENIDLEKGTVVYHRADAEPFMLPLSDFLIDLLKRRKACAETIELFGDDYPWVFPSLLAACGHLVEEKLNLSEKKLFKQHWSPHTLRHSYTSIADNKVKIPKAHSKMLVDHKIRFAINGDVHEGYNHPDLDDLRESQQRMTDYILAQIKPKPAKGKKRGNNVVMFKIRHTA